MALKKYCVWDEPVASVGTMDGQADPKASTIK